MRVHPTIHAPTGRAVNHDSRVAASLRSRESVQVAARWVRDDRFAVFVAAIVWVLIVLMIVPDGFKYETLGPGEMPAAGSPLARMLWLGLLGSGALILFWRGMLSWLVLRSLNPFLLLFVALAAASVVWSIEPTITVRRLIRFATFIAIGFAFVLVGWHARRFQNVLRPILTIMLVGSLIFGIVSPQLAIHESTASELLGAWRGLTNHKNQFGALSSIATIFWFHAWLTKEVSLRASVIGGGISLTCLLLSRSSTALVTTMFVLMFLVMLMHSPRGLRRYMPWLVGMFVVVLLVYSLAILHLVPGSNILLSPITTLTGKDLSFTGRNKIWDIIIEHIRLAPVLGSGYGAYWTGPLWWSPSYDFVRKMDFYPGSAHNGYLEVANDLGFIGLACLVGYLIVHVLHSLRLWHIDRAQASLYLGLFFQQAISNLSETHWLNVLSLNFVIVTLASLALARGLLELKLRNYFGDPHRIRVPRQQPRPRPRFVAPPRRPRSAPR